MVQKKTNLTTLPTNMFTSNNNLFHSEYRFYILQHTMLSVIKSQIKYNMINNLHQDSQIKKLPN